jgi:hypothetical protein
MHLTAGFPYFDKTMRKIILFFSLFPFFLTAPFFVAQFLCSSYAVLMQFSCSFYAALHAVWLSSFFSRILWLHLPSGQSRENFHLQFSPAIHKKHPCKADEF